MCRNVCKICPCLAISTSVTFTDGNLIIELPANSFRGGEKVCIVVAQSIPSDATITAPVVIQIGDGEQLYPLTNRCCAQVNACAIRTRTKYATRVVTSATGGTFRLLGSPACSPNNALESIDGTAPTSEATTTTGGGNNVRNQK